MIGVIGHLICFYSYLLSFLLDNRGRVTTTTGRSKTVQ